MRYARVTEDGLWRRLSNHLNTRRIFRLLQIKAVADDRLKVSQI